MAKLENAGSVSISKNPSRQQQQTRLAKPIPPRQRRTNIDHLYNEGDEDMIEIDPEEQERMLLEAELNCTLRIKSNSNTSYCKKKKKNYFYFYRYNNFRINRMFLF